MNKHSIVFTDEDHEHNTVCSHVQALIASADYNDKTHPVGAQIFRRPRMEVVSNTQYFSSTQNSETALTGFRLALIQPVYLEVTVQQKLRSGWAGPFVKVEGCYD
jgi:hypothetical protein